MKNEAMKQAVRDIRESLRKEGKSYINCSVKRLHELALIGYLGDSYFA